MLSNKSNILLSICFSLFICFFLSLFNIVLVITTVIIIFTGRKSRAMCFLHHNMFTRFVCIDTGT